MMEPELIIQKDRLMFFHDKLNLYLSCEWFIEGRGVNEPSLSELSLFELGLFKFYLSSNSSQT
jgi:hypothetical protein